MVSLEINLLNFGRFKTLSISLRSVEQLGNNHAVVRKLSNEIDLAIYGKAYPDIAV